MRAQCCICADLFVNNAETNIAATTCGHVFHEHCLARWLMTAKTCPSCRKVVNNNAIIPKLYFDIADDDPDEEDPVKVSNELQALRAKIAELKQDNRNFKANEKELKDKVKARDDELETVRILLRQEQDRLAAQQKMLHHYEAASSKHKQERAEFITAQQKLTELRHVEAIVSGDAKDCEEILHQYANGDRGSLLQLAKYASILKREYEQVKADKRQLKEQLDQYKKVSYNASREVQDLKQKNNNIQEQLTRSEEELKQAEKTVTLLKAKVNKLKYSRGHHHGERGGSFLETPGRQEEKDNIFTTTPKLGAVKTPNQDTVTPVFKRPSGGNVFDLEEESPGKLDQSFDLFEESPRTQVRKACEENNMKVVKISSAATSAPKRLKTEEDDLGAAIPLSTLNIMKKREKAGHLLGKTVIRKDYDGLGGTSAFTQSIGLPRFSARKKTVTKFKRTKSGHLPRDPSLPTLDSFIDLT